MHHIIAIAKFTVWLAARLAWCKASKNGYKVLHVTAMKSYRSFGTVS